MFENISEEEYALSSLLIVSDGVPCPYLHKLYSICAAILGTTEFGNKQVAWSSVGTIPAGVKESACTQYSLGFLVVR